MALGEYKTEIQDVVLSREAKELKAQLDKKIKSAEADGKAISIIGKAEGNKSDVVREYELSKYMATIMAEAFSKLPLDNAQWVTVGDNSPAQTLASLLAVGKDILGYRGTD